MSFETPIEKPTLPTLSCHHLRYILSAASLALYLMDESNIKEFDDIDKARTLPNEVSEISDWKTNYPQEEIAIRKYIEDVKSYIQSNKKTE